jgi:hypothetical protein
MDFITVAAKLVLISQSSLISFKKAFRPFVLNLRIYHSPVDVGLKGCALGGTSSIKGIMKQRRHLLCIKTCLWHNS